MTNDLSTLSGALLEMKDQLIYELGQKGVTASYDSSTGLLGLIGEISNIQTGGGSCYKVTFDNASYNTSGSVTVSVTVLKNYSACVGETVTFTSSTSTTTTATTDSNGVATATISFSGSTTLTASIGGVSDTATITVSSYLFYDDCSSSSGLTDYSLLTLRGSSSPTLTFDSTNSCYVLANNASSSGGHSLMAIDSLAGENSYTMQFKTKPYNTTDNGGAGYAYKGSNGMYSIYYMYKTSSSDSGNITINQGSSDSKQTNIGSNHRDEWLTHIITVSNGKVTYVLKDSTDTALYTGSAFTPSKGIQSDTKPGVTILWWNVSKVYVKDIIVEAL